MPKINGKGQGSIFKDEQLDKLFKSLKKEGIFWYCFFKFLYYSGERSGCVIQVKWDDINLNENVIIFRPETRKNSTPRRDVHIHQELKEILVEYKKFHSKKVIEYLEFYGDEYVSEYKDYVFMSPLNPSHISRTGLHQKFKRVLLACGLQNQGFSLHSFRRTFITKIYKVNKNVKECMAITGHASIQSFMRYIDINEDSITETINSL